jgi:hypothetical protein
MIPHYRWGLQVMLEGRKIPSPTAVEVDLADYIVMNFSSSRPQEGLTGSNRYNSLLCYCSLRKA